jgi:pyruvate dehydrogenase E2 component (dihydrolipoamide acetyltransferase)
MALSGDERLAPGGADGRIFASPLARRLAKEGGLDLSALKGSGPHGRIIERDVKSALGSGARPMAAPSAPVIEAPVGMSDAVVRQLFAPGSFTEIPHDSMRKAIARRMVEAVRSIPHFALQTDCEIDALLRLREDYNSAAPKGANGEPEWKVSVNDIIVKAMALALQKVPDANVTFTQTAMLKHISSDVGVAVSIPGGLVTPIVRNAETKNFREIAIELKDLARRARERKLKPNEYEGGTTAVSNLGMFGVKNFAAVINPPHATILAVGAGEERIIARNGAPAVATIMSVTLSVDHRAVDGALGATLLAEFKRLIEHPAAMLV